jgi:hypothetical protein
MLYTIELIRFIPARVGVVSQITYADDDPETAKEKANDSYGNQDRQRYARQALERGRRRGFHFGGPIANASGQHCEAAGSSTAGEMIGRHERTATTRFPVVPS